MKALKLALILLALAAPCYAGNNQITIINTATTPEGKTIRILCIDSYKFVLVEQRSSQHGEAIIQIFRKSEVPRNQKNPEDSPPQPVRCNE